MSSNIEIRNINHENPIDGVQVGLPTEDGVIQVKLNELLDQILSNQSGIIKLNGKYYAPSNIISKL